MRRTKPSVACRACSPSTTSPIRALFEPDWLPRLDLPWDLLGIEALEFYGRISFLKAGINYSTFLTTVSPTYAQEIQTPELGFGFDGILRRRSADLVGILNGIDTVQWNPMRDPHLPAPFSAADLSGKRAAKAAVLAALRACRATTSVCWTVRSSA